ncbi:hypothetical protein ACFU93_25355 [Streptomyces sp. NPDC057611]|uniref:hypothetical protein n=1 Tax=Streptomyces sp. NPDC057611 TaxID=3346182 RepID=UPI003679DE94
MPDERRPNTVACGLRGRRAPPQTNRPACPHTVRAGDSKDVSRPDLAFSSDTSRRGRHRLT